MLDIDSRVRLRIPCLYANCLRRYDGCLPHKALLDV